MRRWMWPAWKTRKKDAAAPTVATESIFIISAIDAHERRDVATIDTTGAFLHADSYEHIFMVLKGKLDILICNVDKKLYRKYIIFDKRGKNVLYVKMLKALYGMLRSALLFYRKLVKDLLNTDLKRTHTVLVFLTVLTMEKQLTVTFNVDNLRLSHMYLVDITLFTCYLSRIYGNNLVVHR